jgi:hypothetical protein
MRLRVLLVSLFVPAMLFAQFLDSRVTALRTGAP